LRSMRTPLRTDELHSISRSVLLHLLPGVPIYVLFLAFARPEVSSAFGVAEELGPGIAFVIATALGGIGVQLGYLYVQRQRAQSKHSTVLDYLESTPLWQYVLLVPPLLAWLVGCFLLLAPRLNAAVIDALFSWYPQSLNLQNALATPQRFAGLPGARTTAILYLVFAAILGPLVEELYFRGHLLPRLAHLGPWAPLVHTVLFSLYHVFSPWENPVRILAGIPVTYVVYWKRDIRISIFIHIVANTIGAIVFLLAVFR
jgi:membrane protease YdiL (CAAX protease family)